jgi:hypothetical protein
MEEKVFPTLKNKYPSLKTHFDETFTVCQQGAGSDRRDVSIDPLQCKVRQGRKTVSPFRVKCRFYQRI